MTTPSPSRAADSLVSMAAKSARYTYESCLYTWCQGKGGDARAAAIMRAYEQEEDAYGIARKLPWIPIAKACLAAGADTTSYVVKCFEMTGMSSSPPSPAQMSQAARVASYASARASAMSSIPHLVAGEDALLAAEISMRVRHGASVEKAMESVLSDRHVLVGALHRVVVASAFGLQDLASEWMPAAVACYAKAPAVLEGIYGAGLPVQVREGFMALKEGLHK